MSVSNHSAPRATRRFRKALLGASAMVVVAGGVAHLALPASPALAAIPQAQGAMPGSFADTVDRVRGAVVSVKVNIVNASDTEDSNAGSAPGMNLQPGDPLERFFRQFGENGMGMPRQQQPHRMQAQGSGFFISADGYIVTNNHVVENASDVTVTLDDGRTVPATVIGTDKKTDLALLKTKEGGSYPFVDWANGNPRVGDWVIAVGNPFGLGGTVTAGIVSARGRDIGAGPYDDFLQIDAPVNRGNSGGPTFDTAGNVVGINTAIYSPSGGSVGIGFAIPAEVAKTVIASLKDKGSVARGWIGVQIQPVTGDIADSLGLKSQKGALVAETQANSPAKAAGIVSGDVITAVNGEAVDGPRDLARRVAGFGPDKHVDVTYLHNGAEKTASVTLGSLPADQQQASNDRNPQGAERNALSGFGLTLAPNREGREGVVVAGIDPDGAAAQKGLRQGDVILEAAGKAVSRPSQVQSAVSDARKDGRKAVLLRVKTGDQTRFVALAANPAG